MKLIQEQRFYCLTRPWIFLCRVEPNGSGDNWNLEEEVALANREKNDHATMTMPLCMSSSDTVPHGDHKIDCDIGAGLCNVRPVQRLAGLVARFKGDRF